MRVRPRHIKFLKYIDFVLKSSPRPSRRPWRGLILFIILYLCVVYMFCIHICIYIYIYIIYIYILYIYICIITLFYVRIEETCEAIHAYSAFQNRDCRVVVFLLFLHSVQLRGARLADHNLHHRGKLKRSVYFLVLSFMPCITSCC